MGKVAYRFIPCDNEGRPREQSQFTSIHDATQTVGVGSVIEADLLGYRRWKVIEVREGSEGLMSVTGADGDPISVAGTLVCRGVGEHSWTLAQRRVLLPGARPAGEAKWLVPPPQGYFYAGATAGIAPG